MISTGLNLLVSPLHTTGMIRTLTNLFIFHTLLDHHHHPIKSENENEEWRIEYQRTIKKIRTDHPELDYDYYIDSHCGISPPYASIPASLIPSTRGKHTYDCRCHTCYDWTKDSNISSNTGSSDRSSSHQAYEGE